MIAMDNRNKKQQIEHEKLKQHYQENVLNQRLMFDKYDSYSRQDHVILLGRTEPDKNYEAYGKETQEEFEDMLHEIGQKVGIDIQPGHISLAHRLGNNHKDSDNRKKYRDDGTTPIARPILFKLSNRYKRNELLRKKKTLRVTHRVKIIEDVTPLRKALCDFVNKQSTVKIAYPQDGKICVRLHANENKVIRLESYKDLDKIGISVPTEDLDWAELKLDGLQL